MIEDSNVTKVDHGPHCKVAQDCTWRLPTLFTIINVVIKKITAHWLIKIKSQTFNNISFGNCEGGGPYTIAANSKDTLTFPNHILISITKCYDFMNMVCINLLMNLLLLWIFQLNVLSALFRGAFNYLASRRMCVVPCDEVHIGIYVATCSWQKGGVLQFCRFRNWNCLGKHENNLWNLTR